MPVARGTIAVAKIIGMARLFRKKEEGHAATHARRRGKLTLPTW